LRRSQPFRVASCALAGLLLAVSAGADEPGPAPVAARVEGYLGGAVIHESGNDRESALDAGGIGKGIALDAMAALLRRRGARAAFLDFGGSSQLAIGAPEAEASGWRVGIGGLSQGRVLGEITLRDAALSTSRASGGPTPAGPIIDPRSGAPVFAPRIATARAADATSAEAWTKALIVDGRAALPAARRHGIAALVEDGDGIAADDLTPQPLRP